MKRQRTRLLGRTVGNVTHLKIDDDARHLNQKALGGGIGRRISKLRERFDPNAEDGDGDKLVQDGTQWQRPAPLASRILRRVINRISGRRRSSEDDDAADYAEDINDSGNFPSSDSPNLNKVTAESIKTKIKDIDDFVNKKYGKIETQDDLLNALKQAFPNINLSPTRGYARGIKQARFSPVKIKNQQQISEAEKGTFFTLLYYADKNPDAAKYIMRFEFGDRFDAAKNKRKKTAYGTMGWRVDEESGRFPRMGVVLWFRQANPNIRKEILDEPKKNPKALKFKPAAEALYLMAQEGAPDDLLARTRAMSTAMHEWAHTMHYANMDRELRGPESVVLSPVQRYKAYWKTISQDDRRIAFQFSQLDKLENTLNRRMRSKDDQQKLKQLFKLYQNRIAAARNKQFEEAFSKELSAMKEKITMLNADLKRNSGIDVLDKIEWQLIKLENSPLLDAIIDAESLDKLQDVLISIAKVNKEQDPEYWMLEIVRSMYLNSSWINSEKFMLDKFSTKEMAEFRERLLDARYTSGYAYSSMSLEKHATHGVMEGFAEAFVRQELGGFVDILNRMLEWGTKEYDDADQWILAMLEANQMGRDGNEISWCLGYFDYPTSSTAVGAMSNKSRFDPNAEDGDHDGFVQDDEPLYRRPARPGAALPINIAGSMLSRSTGNNSKRRRKANPKRIKISGTPDDRKVKLAIRQQDRLDDEFDDVMRRLDDGLRDQVRRDGHDETRSHVRQMISSIDKLIDKMQDSLEKAIDTNDLQEEIRAGRTLERILDRREMLQEFLDGLG